MIVVDEKPFWLLILKHRYYCDSCKKPFTELSPGTYLRRRSTQKFRNWIKTCCLNFTTLKSVSVHAFCSQGFVYKAFYEQLEVKIREHQTNHWPAYVGIDEHFFTRRRCFSEYVTVFTDLKKHKVFEVAQSKVKSKLIQSMKNISGRENVRVVCIDLAPGYKSFVKEFFPNAKIVGSPRLRV